MKHTINGSKEGGLLLTLLVTVTLVELDYYTLMYRGSVTITIISVDGK